MKVQSREGSAQPIRAHALTMQPHAAASYATA